MDSTPPLTQIGLRWQTIKIPLFKHFSMPAFQQPSRLSIFFFVILKILVFHFVTIISYFIGIVMGCKIDMYTEFVHGSLPQGLGEGARSVPQLNSAKLCTPTAISWSVSCFDPSMVSTLKSASSLSPI